MNTLTIIAACIGTGMLGFALCAILTAGSVSDDTDQYNEGFDAGVRFCAGNVVDGMRGEG